jgi:cytochrome c oxidase subunit 2
MNNAMPIIPERASVLADKFEPLFWYVTAVTGLATLLVCFGLVVFCIKYRRGATTGSTPRILGSHRLELFWTVTPLLIFLTFFGWGAVVFDYAFRPAPDAMEVYIIGKQWMWKAQYPDGQRVIIGGNTRNMEEEERRQIGALVLPVDRPVKFTMISEDVIHSFGIPAFRIKVDVLPGRYTTQWNHPNKVGEYHLFCNQYCGTWHSVMVGKVRVVPQDDFEAFLQGRANPSSPVTGGPPDGSPAWHGQQLFRKLQCINCHVPSAGSMAGRHPRAPNLEGLHGEPVPVAGGGTVVADDAYVVESILNPQAKVVEGWKERSIMPSYQGEVSAEDLNALVAYLRYLKGGKILPPNAKDPAPVGAPGAQPKPPSGSEKQ